MKLLCLANSYKKGGRCIAGILLDDNNIPILKNNKPRWIRPICKTNYGQVPNYLCDKILPLDIIQINDTNHVGIGYQSENTTFDESQILIIDKANKNILDDLYAETHLIFGNRGKALPEDTIKKIDHSLILVNSSDFKIVEKEYEEKEYPQIRLNFTYNNNFYDFPITDPIFLKKYDKDKSVLDKIENIDIVVSLSVPFKNWYYKLVATILY
ncbi:MAG: dual OB domain-containing protein [Polaribacter sp.]